MDSLTHIIGAGLAGLAAAIKLTEAGQRVVLHEAAPHAGGRCRSYFDRTLNATIDNGNHLVLSGNRDTLAYVQAIGAQDQLQGPEHANFPFFDLSSGARWNVNLSMGKIPAWIFDAARRPPGTRPQDFLALLRLLRARPHQTFADLELCSGPLWERLVRPLFLAVLNTEPAEGSAWLARNVMLETLVAGGRACRPLVALHGLGPAFIEPALRYLEQRGAAIHLGHRLRGVELGAGQRMAALDFDTGRLALGEHDAVILAVPPNVAQTLLPGITAPASYRAIVNLHYGVAPPAGCAPITGMLNSMSEWLFAFDGRLSVTISGADRLLDLDREELARLGWAEVAAAAGLPLEPMPVWQVVRERRATFAAVPEAEALRPATRTAWRNVMLAGDWTATGLPATIEGAIRSGNQAARFLLRDTH